jgi:hypothetical protein
VKFTNTAGAAEYLQLAVSTLEKLRVGGGGPAYHKLGRTVRYRVDDLDDWAMSRRVRNTSEVVGY